MTDTLAPPSHRHLIEVVGTGDDQSFNVICPDDGRHCQSCVECSKEHRCDCGPHPHDDRCDEDCTVDHAEECDDWLWRDGMMHGEYHVLADDLFCLLDSACWMPEWDIEFADYGVEYAPGRYEFDYDQGTDAVSGLLYVTAMRPATD